MRQAGAETENGGWGGLCRRGGFLRIVFISVSPAVIHSGSALSGKLGAPCTGMLSAVFQVRAVLDSLAKPLLDVSPVLRAKVQMKLHFLLWDTKN